MRVGKIRLWKLLVAGGVLGICAAFPVYMRIPQQCVLCRAERNTFHVFGTSFSAGFRGDGEFTRWYLAHRPPHTHVWHCSAHGCLPDRNFFGLPLSLYMMMGHPVLHLTPSQELQFVQHSDEATLTQFFADAGSTNLEAQLRASDTVRKTLSDVR
jgi:hypothetical protein